MPEMFDIIKPTPKWQQLKNTARIHM